MLRRERSIPWAAVLLLALPLAARAQEAGPAPRLLPGDPSIDARRITPGAAELRVIVRQGGQEEQFSTVTDRIREIRLDGRAALERVQTARMPFGVVVDTVVVWKETLAPVWHRSHHPQRVMMLDYDGAKVSGRITYADGEAEEVDAALEVAAFDSNPLDLLIRSLPLAEGYAARVPVYLHDLGGLLWLTARVTGSEFVESKEGRKDDAWVVDVDVDGRVSRYWVHKTSHAMLQQGSATPTGVEVRVVP